MPETADLATNGLPDTQHHETQSEQSLRRYAADSDVQSAEMVYRRSNRQLSRDNQRYRPCDTDPGYHIDGRCDDNDTEKSRTQRIPGHRLPHTQLAAANDDQRDGDRDNSAKVNDEYALEQTQSLVDHARQGCLQPDRDSAEQADNDDQE